MDKEILQLLLLSYVTLNVYIRHIEEIFSCMCQVIQVLGLWLSLLRLDCTKLMDSQISSSYNEDVESDHISL